MAAEKRYRGVESSQELDGRQTRPDTRTMSSKARAFFATTDGAVFMAGALPVSGLLLLWLPFSGEMLLLLAYMFYQFYVNPGHTDGERKDAAGNIRGKHRVYDFPFRVPRQAKIFDGSYTQPKLGAGITFLGREISTKLEIWSSDSDLRTHMLVLGTTGSGKTEFLLGLVYNALVQNSGFIYTDGKGAVDLYLNVFRLARYLGREGDLLVVNFLTSGRDFLDKQLDRTTNTMNPFALGSSGMLIELIISLMDDSGGGGDMWKGRAISFVAGLTRVLCYLRDRGYILLDSAKFIEFFELPIVEAVVFDKKITVNNKDITITDPLFEKVLEPLKNFVLTLPGYSRDKKGQQEQKTMEQHGFITMQLTRLFGDLSFTYGYIFQTLLGEVDMYDVVINRRILVVLLPALERAPDSLKMLGKLIVGSIKQMMAGCLGNRLEGSVREIVDARPTNADVPFYVVLDEYGYYAVLGFAVAPAQARSLGFPQPLRSLVKVGPGQYKTMGEMMPDDAIMLPTGAMSRVREVRLTGHLPVARLTTCSGKSAEAAYSHHWPVRVREQDKIMTTREIEHAMAQGESIALGAMSDGGLRFDTIESIEFIGIEPTRCLVVEDELHCYVTNDDLVTHNCITFAAQDFSSLQKASKEEADATWENTNLRVVGRITSGSESETWRRIAGVGSEAAVHESGRKEHTTGFMDGYRSNLDANVTTAKRISYDDLAEQENGEFTFLIGKKNKSGTGGVRVIRARTFFTQVKERPERMRVNRFLKVEPPRTGLNDDDFDTIVDLEKALGEIFKSGKLAEIVSNDPTAEVKGVPYDKLQPLNKFAHFLHEAREGARLPLHQAVRAAFLCELEEGDVVTATRAKAATAAAGSGQALAPAPSENLVADFIAQHSEDVAVAAVDSGEVVESLEIDLSDPDADTAPNGVAGLLDGDELAIDLGEEPQSRALESIDLNDDLVGEAGIALDRDDEVLTVDVSDVDLLLGGEVKADDSDSDTESESSTSGGLGLTLVPMDRPVEESVSVAPARAPAAESAVLEDVQVDAKLAVLDYLDNYEFGVPFGEGDAKGDGTSTATTPRKKVSTLTLRVLGVDAEEGENEITDYLVEQLMVTETALGIVKDSLAIKVNATRAAADLERQTSYVDGPTPSAPTIEDWDAAVDGLADAASRNPPNYL